MNILHVLSQFEVTGAEAYAASLIAEQVKDGHTIFLVSDTLTLPIRGTYIQMPIGRRSYPQRLRNIASLTRFIRRNKVDVVHAHSRAASWVSFFATLVTRSPFVSTVHGRQHIHASSKAFSVYGRNVIAVCDSVRDHLLADLGFRPQDVTVIPNCIPLRRWESTASTVSKREHLGVTGQRSVVMFVGRLTGPKGEVARFLLKSVLPLVLKRRPVFLALVGGMIVPDDIPALAASLNESFAEPTVTVKGFQPNIAQYISCADVVIGSGRVVPESLALKKPVVAFGESNYVGPVTAASFAHSASTNFGDTGGFAPADPSVVASDLIRLLEHPPTAAELDELLSLSQKRFDSEIVAQKVHGIYERAYARTHSPFSIPVLMYHRVIEHPLSDTAHGIWVTAEQFAAQLRSLRNRGFETITFRDCAEFLRGRQLLPRRPIILTFDDGYEDNYTVAFPVLQQFRFRAVIFTVTDPQRRTNFWDPEEPPARLLDMRQLQELARHGIEIGSHTVSHAKLTATPSDIARKELQESKDVLEQLLGSEVLSFAYPYGAVDLKAKQLVREAGYRFAAAGNSGPLRFADDFTEIRRTQVFPWTSRFGFWKKTQPAYQRYRLLKRRRAKVTLPR